MKIRTAARWRLHQKAQRAHETFDARLAKMGLRRLPASEPVFVRIDVARQAGKEKG